MKTKTGITLLLLIGLILAGCEKEGKTFEISGTPDPILYGHCNEPTLTFMVTGPGDGLRVDGVIVAYNLFDEGGIKVKSGSLNLKYSPFHPAVTYIGSVTFKIASGPAPSAPDDLVPFGEGRVEFAATVTAFKLSPDGGTTYFITSTKSVRVMPCGPTALPPGGGPKPTATPIPTATATSIPTATATPTATASPTPRIEPAIKPTKECNPVLQQCP